MSERFPPLELTSDLARELEDEFKKHYGPNPNFKWKNDKGEPIGPFAVLAYEPLLLRVLLKTDLTFSMPDIHRIYFGRGWCWETLFYTKGPSTLAAMN